MIKHAKIRLGDLEIEIVRESTRLVAKITNGKIIQEIPVQPETLAEFINDLTDEVRDFLSDMRLVGAITRPKTMPLQAFRTIVDPDLKKKRHDTP